MSGSVTTAKIRGDEEQALQHLRLLGHSLVEIRALYRHGRPKNEYFTVLRDAADHAAGLASHTGEDEFMGIFVNANRIHPDLAGRCDGGGAAAKYIVRLTTLPIDVDPVRDHPDGGKVCSTETEHETAIALAHRVQEELLADGWPEPVFVDTGNGARLDFGIDLEPTPENVALVGATLGALAKRFNNELAHVDTSVGDPARILRIAGSVNRKSVHTEERPNRRVYLVSPPESLATVSEEQLRAVAGTFHVSKPNFAPPESDDIHQLRVTAVLRTLEAAKIQHGPPDDDKPEFTRIALPICPFKDGHHTDGNAAVLVFHDGAIALKCFHDECKGKSWRQFLRITRAPFVECAEQVAAEQILGETRRSMADPLVLAQAYLATQAAEDGTTKYVHFLGDSYRYDDRHGWLATRPKDIEAFVRAIVQERYDAIAALLSIILGRDVVIKPVYSRTVAETIKAMDSLCRQDIEVTAQAPFWLKPHDWLPNDLLVFRNGILNVHHYITDREDYFIPRTPQLFARYQADFDFLANAPHPQEWHKFLKSLGRPDDWYEALQQIAGYCLWRGYDLQKYFMFVGPGRCGKGTLIRVIRDLVGGPSAVCAPGLKDFAMPFGLEQTIDKVLALVPEVKLPAENRHEIVATVKAITGGDLVTVNRKHKPNLPMQMKLKILMQSNCFVPLPDNSGALHMRLIPLMFTISFLGREDRELPGKLAAEYPGILLWCLEGLRSLYQRGQFVLPNDSLVQLEQLRVESAPLQAFLEEVCTFDTQKAVCSIAMYEIYKRWFTSHWPESQALSDNSFALEFRTAALSIIKVRGRRPGDREFDGRVIVPTDFDAKSNRPYIWLGVCPKPEFRSKAAFVEV